MNRYKNGSLIDSWVVSLEYYIFRVSNSNSVFKFSSYFFKRKTDFEIKKNFKSI